MAEFEKNYTRHAIVNSDLVSSLICKSTSFIRNFSKTSQIATSKETHRCEKLANSYHVTKFYRKNEKIFVPWIKKTGCGLASFGSEQVPIARCLEKGLSTISVLSNGFLKQQYI
jgi:hypothetical protein